MDEELPATAGELRGRFAVDRLVPATSLLLVVDVQERLAAAMPEPTMGRLVANAGLLLEAA